MRKYHFDDLGNPTYYYDERTGHRFIPRAQNKAYPEPDTFIVGNSPVTPLPRKEPARPIFSYKNGKPRLPLDQPENELTDWPEPGSVLSEPTILEELAKAKRGGAGMKASIRRITGVTAGGSPAYDDWRRVWLDLPEKE